MSPLHCAVTGLFLFPRSLLALTRLVAGNRGAPPTMRIFSYKSAGETKIEADAYRAEVDGTRPVFVRIHGGALVLASRKGVPVRLRDLCRDKAVPRASRRLIPARRGTTPA